MDRSRWREQRGGPPLFTSRAFLYWLSIISAAVDVGSLVTTAATWPQWHERAVNGDLAQLHLELVDASTSIALPADGMAYVYTVRRRDNPVHIHGDVEWEVITLILEEDEWRVHSTGDMVSPELTWKDRLFLVNPVRTSRDGRDATRG